MAKSKMTLFSNRNNTCGCSSEKRSLSKGSRGRGKFHSSTRPYTPVTFTWLVAFSNYRSFSSNNKQKMSFRSYLVYEFFLQKEKIKTERLRKGKRKKRYNLWFSIHQLSFLSSWSLYLSARSGKKMSLRTWSFKFPRRDWQAAVHPNYLQY